MVTNKIKLLFESMTDDELIDAINEIKESEYTGIIGNIVRKYAQLITEITGDYSSLDLYFTQINLLKEAAYRWYPKKIN